jgi:hypothetical protein
MATKLIGREEECAELQRCLTSNRSELVIVYGRRRIGKTFLIEQYFDKKFDFSFVGVHGLSTRNQLRQFAKVLSGYSQISFTFKDWFDAFDALQNYLTTLSDTRKKVVFIDEMPWMDTGRSDFVVALENFWNGWAMRQENIMLIATGSATSWMRDKIVSNQGGLHARVTCMLHLAPFTLHETEQYLASMGIIWDRYQIVQSYMILGGVPYYYSILNDQLSLAQNIDNLFFKTDGKLRIEFDELYYALFKNADLYIDIVKALSKNKSGLTYKEITTALKQEGGKITKALKNLERSDFIERWNQFGNKKRQEVLRLTDFYTLFYYKFISGRNDKDEQWWTNNFGSQALTAWMGLSYELVCLRHHKQIKKALGISGISTSVSTWQCKPNEEEQTPGAQIDMVIDRADRIIHLCEIKFSESEYHISQEYERKIRERMGLFKYLTKTKKTTVNTFITTYGVAGGKHKSIVNSEITLNDLFSI